MTKFCMTMTKLALLSLFGCSLSTTVAFVVVGRDTPSRATALFSTQQQNEEASKLLERARAMRAEIAALEGRSVDEVEAEAKQARESRRQAEQERTERSVKRRKESANVRRTGGSFLEIPETFDAQVTQAKAAVERAFRDGLTRQTVRFAPVPEDGVLNEDRQWPGGAQQIYREACGPLTRELLRQLRPSNDTSSEVAAFQQAPAVKSQDIWDFDGSALITAESSLGPSSDVQALVLPNTDVKYVKDIAQIRKAMGDRLFLLVNPFWRNVDSWGYNLFAPNAKNLAQQEIFDQGFDETYCLMQKSVRGEDCIALKAYPYDWQLYAYAEDEYWPNQNVLVRLGSTKEEPTASDFGKLLEQREEFKMSKNMRQMQRMMNKDE